MALFGNLIGFGDMPARKVAAANIENLAFADKLFHPLPDFLPGRVAVNVVHLVHINVVGLQAFQAGLARAFDVQC